MSTLKTFRISVNRLGERRRAAHCAIANAIRDGAPSGATHFRVTLDYVTFMWQGWVWECSPLPAKVYETVLIQDQDLDWEFKPFTEDLRFHRIRPVLHRASSKRPPYKRNTEHREPITYIRVRGREVAINKSELGNYGVEL